MATCKILDDIRQRLRTDPSAKEQLKEALERVSMGGDGYVSMVDSVSLANWLPQVFPDISRDAFNDVYLKDLKKLGEEILQ